jgi:hypothetical protein
LVLPIVAVCLARSLQYGDAHSTSLAPESFSLTNVVYSFGMPLDGKVTVEAKSADETAGCFFMRAKLQY